MIRKTEFIIKPENKDINFVKKTNEQFIFGEIEEPMPIQTNEVSNTVSVRNTHNVNRRLSFINNTGNYDVEEEVGERMITGVGYVSGVQAFVSNYINTRENYIEDDDDDDVDDDEDILNSNFDSDESFDSF